MKSRKLYWSDCGLAAWRAGIRSRDDLSQRHDQGFWLEQALFQTLQSWSALDPASRRIWYWRERSGREVDFVLYTRANRAYLPKPSIALPWGWMVPRK